MKLRNTRKHPHPPRGRSALGVEVVHSPLDATVFLQGGAKGLGPVLARVAFDPSDLVSRDRAATVAAMAAENKGYRMVAVIRDGQRLATKQGRGNED